MILSAITFAAGLAAYCLGVALLSPVLAAIGAAALVMGATAFTIAISTEEEESE